MNTNLLRLHSQPHFHLHLRCHFQSPNHFSKSPPARDRVIDFGKHKGKPLGALPSTYLKWVSKTLRARDTHHWAHLADQVLQDPVYRDRIEWEFAQNVLHGGASNSRSGGAVAELLEISERFGWDNDDKDAWKRVDFELLGTSKGGRIPRRTESGIPRRRENGISPGNEILRRRENGISRGTGNGISRRRENGISLGMENGIRRRRENGISRRRENGISRETENGISRRRENGISREMENGISRGTENGISREMENGIVRGTENAIERRRERVRRRVGESGNEVGSEKKENGKENEREKEKAKVYNPFPGREGLLNEVLRGRRFL